ncbi:MAG: stage III sporulation protein AB [Clostridia bacterium]|nr:stage III sporulation protein AB [Clostridia bacterium]
MNILIGACLLVLCSFIGLKIADNYRKKLKFIQDFQGLLDYLENNILFMQDDLRKLLEDKKKNVHKDFSNFLSQFIQNLENCKHFLQEWKETQKIISQENAELIVNFMTGLGRNDSATQLQAINQTKEILQNQIKKVQNEQKKGLLSSKLGIMGGLALFIIVL